MFKKNPRLRVTCLIGTIDLWLYGAWCEGQHNDLVLAVSFALSRRQARRDKKACFRMKVNKEKR